MLLENQIQSHGLPHCRLPQTPSILTFLILATRGLFGGYFLVEWLKISLSSYKHWKGALGWSEIRKLDRGKKASKPHWEKWNLKISYLLSSVVEFSLIFPRLPEIWLGRRVYTCNPALMGWREEGHKFKASLHTFTMMTEYPVCSPQWILNKPKKGSRGNRKKNRGRDGCRQSRTCGCPLTVWEPKQKKDYRTKAMEAKAVWLTCMLPGLQTGHVATATQYTTVRQSQPSSEENLRGYLVSKEQREERARDWLSAPTSAPTTISQTNPSLPPLSCQVPGEAHWVPIQGLPMVMR